MVKDLRPMGSCVSNQSVLDTRNGNTLEKKARALLETYPAPTKYRLGVSTRSSSGTGNTAAMVHHWESKIRPPAVHSAASRIPKPADSNGNSRSEPAPATLLPRKAAPISVPAAAKVKPTSPGSTLSSVSSLSSGSMTSSRSSSRSVNSMEDSGIANTSSTPSLSARKSALSLKLNPSTPKTLSKLPKPAKGIAQPPAAQSQKRAADTKNKLDVIAASLEKEVMEKITAEKPIRVEKKRSVEQCIPAPVTTVTTCEVESFVLYPGHPELAYVETPASVTEELIEDISPLPTPASLCSSVNSPQETANGSSAQVCSSAAGCRVEEEESPTNSLSDALIDDEIADQPGLLMLNQSDSLPGSPGRAWSPELHFNRTAATVSQATLSMISCQSFESDCLPMDDSIFEGVLRRRVASVTDVSGEESTLGAGNMRVELFNQSGEQGRISSEEYNAMVSDLAEIKSALMELQQTLQEDATTDLKGDSDGHVVDHGSSQCAAAGVWDLKREIVLMREELKEKSQTIRTLKQELRLAKTKSGEVSPSSARSLSNVATQTDRPKLSVLSNGLSPSKETTEGNLISSFRIGQF